MSAPNTYNKCQDVSYQMVARTPPVNPCDVDTAEAAIEIVILWGEHSILHIEHISPPRSYTVGDAVDAQGKRLTDYLIGSDTLGYRRLPIVVEQGSRGAIVIPRGATGELTIDDQIVSFEELARQGLLQDTVEPPGARLYALPLGASARMYHRGFTFVVRPVAAARKVGISAREKPKAVDRWTLGSLLLHAGILVSFQFLPPRSAALSLDLLNADSRLVDYMLEPRETVDMPEPTWLRDSAETTPKDEDGGGGTGKQHKGDDGKMGKPEQAPSQRRLAPQGPSKSPVPRTPLTDSEADAASAGIIGLLKASSLRAPTSRFGREGADLSNAIGAIIGEHTGGDLDLGGLSMRGLGRGGGGDGRGTIGVGDLGTRGHGGDGTTPEGYPNAGGFHARVGKVPRVRGLPAQVHGSLSKELIRRVIRRHINEVRGCYEQALNARPDLQGRMVVRFIITASGQVGAAAMERSELGAPRVEQCVTRAVQRWTFPAPEAGDTVSVSYPFVFSQIGD